MALDDRTRPSVAAALDELRVRVEQDMRALVDQLVASAAQEREEAVSAARRAAFDEAWHNTQREVAEAEVRVRGSLTAAIEARERDMKTGLARLVENVRRLDAGGSLSEILDRLGDAVSGEAARAALFVVRHERLIGWRFSGFGEYDAQPKAVDRGLNESGVIALAVRDAQMVRTADGQQGDNGPGFAEVPAGCQGVAVPLIVGGRVVAVVYADNVGIARSDAWPDVIEMLTRHGARCLEALTVQKAAAPSPRFWVPPSGQSASTAAVKSPEAPGVPASDVSSGMMA